jgi:hypothetical protein
MDESNRFRPDDDVTFQKLGEETVIVHLGTGRIHHTNATGSRIWELIEGGRSLGEIREALVGEFDASPGHLQEALETFVAQLSAEQMIHAIKE